MPFGVVVLAAGEGRRFGATKQLVPLGGRPLVVHAVDGAIASGADRVVVVTGHDHDAVRAAVLDRDEAGADLVGVVRNPRWAQGQSTSVGVGVAALAAAVEPNGDGPAVDVAVVVLGDVPGTRAATIARVAAAAAEHGTGARTRYTDGPGHPVAFARQAWARLTDLHGDVGARQLRDLDLAEVAAPGPRPRDVDVPADLARVRGEPPRLLDRERPGGDAAPSGA